MISGARDRFDLDFSEIHEAVFPADVRSHDRISTLGAFMKVRDEVISKPWPAWTAIGITELAIPGARVEIRVLAA